MTRSQDHHEHPRPVLDHAMPALNGPGNSDLLKHRRKRKNKILICLNPETLKTAPHRHPEAAKTSQATKPVSAQGSRSGKATVAQSGRQGGGGLGKERGCSNQGAGGSPAECLTLLSSLHIYSTSPPESAGPHVAVLFGTRAAGLGGKRTAR